MHELSVLLSCSNKQPPVWKAKNMSCFEWSLKTGLSVYSIKQLCVMKIRIRSHCMETHNQSDKYQEVGCPASTPCRVKYAKTTTKTIIVSQPWLEYKIISHQIGYSAFLPVSTKLIVLVIFSLYKTKLVDPWDRQKRDQHVLLKKVVMDVTICR